MKRPILFVCGAALLAAVVGCTTPGRQCTGLIRGSCQQAPETCASCADCGQAAWRDPAVVAKRAVDPGRPSHGRGCPHCRDRGPAVKDPGPAVGAVTYPYYTVRGPRDFLAKNPRSIGP